MNIVVSSSPSFGWLYFSLLPDATIEGVELPKYLFHCFTFPFELSCLVRFPINVVRDSIFAFMEALVTHNLSSCRLLNLDSASLIKTNGSVMSPFSQLSLLQTTKCQNSYTGTVRQVRKSMIRSWSFCPPAFSISYWQASNQLLIFMISWPSCSEQNVFIFLMMLNIALFVPFEAL